MGKRGIKSKLQDVTILEQYLKEGKTNKEIAEIFDAPVNTVKYWITHYKLGGLRRRGQPKKKEAPTKKEVEKPQVAADINKDRHLCKTCIYRTRESKCGCDYILITGHSRGCTVEECDKYTKGTKCRNNPKPILESR